MDTNISIRGKVVAILEQKKRIVAKVSYSPGFITIPLDSAPEFRLNDLLEIDGKFVVDNISFDLNEDDIIDMKLN